MKLFISMLSLIMAALMLSSTASANGGCTTADPNGHGDKFCVGDTVSSRYSYQRGSIYNVYYGGYADVNWYGGSSSREHVSNLNLEPGQQPGNGGGGYNPPPPPPPEYQSVTDVYGNQVRVGDTVKYYYNEAVGTVENVYPSSNRLDVRWNINGSGYGRGLPATEVVKLGSSGYQPRKVYDSRGSELYVGARVKYLFNEAVGTVQSVNTDSGTVDVSWNIYGSGYGVNIPGSQVTIR